MRLMFVQSRGTFVPPNDFNAVSGWTHNTHYLSRTPGSSGSRRKFTLSGWIKRVATGAELYWFTGGGGGSGNICVVEWNTSDKLRIVHTGAGAVVLSSGTYSSTTGWYHVVIAFDTEQATAANRVHAYINGSEISYDGSTSYPAINTDIQINTASFALRLGDVDSAATAAGQKLAYAQFIDGAQLTPSDFSQAGEGGTVPKLYTGAFGTNGWALNFANSSDIGNDVSGNANDLTVTGLTSSNVSAETVFY